MTVDTPTNAIEIALAHHRSGRLDQAEQVYRQLLAAQPRDAGLVQLLGLVALQRGELATAETLIGQAIEIDGNQAVFHANLGEVYRAQRQFDRARVSYERSVAIDPRVPEAQNNLGTLLQAEGRLDEALDCYRQALSLRAGYADAHNNLGSVLQAQGRVDEAIAAFRRATEADPNSARALFNLGVIHQRALARHETACRYFRLAAAIAPSDADAHYRLAISLQARGELAEAEAAYRRALALLPDWADVHCALGTLLQTQSRYDEAIDCYREAVRLDPQNTKAHYNWGTAFVALRRPELALAKYRDAIACRADFADAHYNLGTVLHELGRLDEAAGAYCEAIHLRPAMTLAHNNLGNVYQLQGRIAEAIASYRAALTCSPDSGAVDDNLGEVYNNLGTLYCNAGQLADSLECYRSAARLMPDSADACSNLAAALHQQGDYRGAEDYFARSLAIDPHLPEAHYNRSLLLLALGRMAEAWPDFAWRTRCKQYPLRQFDVPAWDGGQLAGRTLLVHAEQGFGDTMMLVRYLDLLRERGARVLFEVQPPLMPLLETSGVGGLVAAGTPLPPFDMYAPILSLPGLIGTVLETIPAGTPYLAASTPLVEHWARELAGVSGLKVGIHWQGNRAYKSDYARSIPLAHFSPLAALPGVTLLSLQKNEAPAELSKVADGWPLVDLASRLDVENGAFMDTAAVMKNLDLVITSDTATAHLAGALGVPVWVALCYAPEWRWFVDREDSPWYPSMRLFRQSSPGDWAGVFSRIADELAARAVSRGSTAKAE